MKIREIEKENGKENGKKEKAGDKIEWYLTEFLVVRFIINRSREGVI